MIQPALAAGDVYRCIVPENLKGFLEIAGDSINLLSSAAARYDILSLQSLPKFYTPMSVP